MSVSVYFVQPAELELMADKDQGRPTATSEPLAEVGAVRQADAALARAYIAALQVASQEQNPMPAELSNQETGEGVGRLASWLVRSHIRRQLLEIANCYTARAQSLVSIDAHDLEWLKTRAAECRQTAAALPRLSRPTVAGAISIATAALAVGSFIAKDQGLVVIAADLAALALVIGSFYGSIWVSHAHRRRRQLFLPDADLVDRLSADKQLAKTEGNVYALEDELYKALRSGKRRERQIDWFVWNLLLFFWPAFLTASLVHDPMWDVLGTAVILNVSTAAWVALRFQRQRLRLWR